MPVAEWSSVLKSGLDTRSWILTAFLEATCAAALMARIAFGPMSVAPQPLLWLAGAGVWMALYLRITLWSTLYILSQEASTDRHAHWRLWVSTIPLLVLSLLGTTLLQVRPGLNDWVWRVLSPIQPFPVVATAIGLLFVWLLKLLAVHGTDMGTGDARSRAWGGSADVAMPTALLLIGILQASAFLVPIGNAFLRFWAIADALGAGTPYPVTATEPGPMEAGSPPYVYDLPLFPLMLRASFALLGHNSAAAHIPAALANALFPLSLYLLIREATGSRSTAITFGALGSLFPFLRFWVLNLPDPDPLLLTSACFAAYFYLRALSRPRASALWVVAGLVAGVLSLSRPEGILYAGFLVLGIALSRPQARQFGMYLFCLALFLVPMVAAWMLNFGFLWPQNYNGTLQLDYPLQNFRILDDRGALQIYQGGLGVYGVWALALLALFIGLVLFGTVAMTIKDRRLLAIALPGIGNTVTIFFANPYIPNTFHFADFFRHASLGLPFLIFTVAYGFHMVYQHLVVRRRWALVAYLGLFLLTASVVREGDILANPTATHRPGQPYATQALATYTYLSMQTILEHPVPLPEMTYHPDGAATVAYPTFMRWPEDILEFYGPLDMAFDSDFRPFGYASVMAFLLALGFALLSERGPAKET